MIGTLDNLITNMNEEEKNETLIVVFIAETDLDYVELIGKEIEIRFNTYVQNGLIEVITIINSIEDIKLTIKLFSIRYYLLQSHTIHRGMT